MKIQTGKGTIALTTLLAIWSVSMVVSLPGLAVSPILGRLHRIFGHATDLEIQMLTSLPSLLIIPFVLLAGKLSVSRNKLLILYTGLIIFFVSGLSCLFVGGMTSLIVVNGILGIGAGMVVPLSTGLVADYFSGRPRVRQLGISSAISNVTLVLATSLTGWLATIDWHYPFLVYLLPGVSLLLTLTLRKAPLPDAISVSAADRSRTSAGESDTAAPVAVFRSSGSSGDGSLSQSSVGRGARPVLTVRLDVRVLKRRRRLMSGRRSVPFRPPCLRGLFFRAGARGRSRQDRPGHRVRGHRLRLPMPVRSKPAGCTGSTAAGWED
ncbi:MFS transporter [Alistipes ihumii]|uniref:MFS transporter n=1 Tax=Alistipes ihumii TaxID=1470347 RepID=UPI0002D7DAA8|nr:MFS transporter [Alistipes ihumii]